MAEDNHISCWTVSQLADVLSQAETRHISARQVFEICTTAFAPDVVAAAVKSLLTEPDWDQRTLYVRIVDALRSLETRLPGTQRQVAHVHTELSRDSDFALTTESEVRRAIADLAGASQGSLVLRGDLLVLNTSIAELAVRLGPLLGTPGEPRRPSTFRSTSS
jgi:hypothetical protein